MLMMLPSCIVKCAQSLGNSVLQRLVSRGALWPGIYPADAHDAPLLPRQMCARTGAVGVATSGLVLWSKNTQQMLMMLACAQSLGQLVLQRLASRGALWQEIFPADAHDAPLLPLQMRAITGAVGFATSGV